MAENPTNAKERQELDASEANQEQPLRQRAVEEDTVSVVGAFLVDNEENIAVQAYHIPGRPLPDHFYETEEASEVVREEQERAEEHAKDVAEHRHTPVVTSPLRVYAERDNIVHPGPTVEQLVADEEIVGEELEADAEIVLNPVHADPLEEDETARDRLESERESVRGERIA